MPDDGTDWGVNPAPESEEAVFDPDAPHTFQLSKGIPNGKPTRGLHQLPDSEGRELKGDELPVPGVHYVEYHGNEWAVVKRADFTEDEYVRREVEQTELQVEKFAIKDKHLTEKGIYVPTDPQERLDRCALHARWRYRGYLAGEVFSL